MHQQDSTEALLFQILYKPYLQFHHAIASISVVVTQVSRNPRCAGEKAEVGSWIVAGSCGAEHYSEHSSGNTSACPPTDSRLLETLRIKQL